MSQVEKCSVNVVTRSMSKAEEEEGRSGGKKAKATALFEEEGLEEGVAVQQHKPKYKRKQKANPKVAVKVAGSLEGEQAVVPERAQEEESQGVSEQQTMAATITERTEPQQQEEQQLAEIQQLGETETEGESAAEEDVSPEAAQKATALVEEVILKEEEPLRKFIQELEPVGRGEEQQEFRKETELDPTLKVRRGLAGKNLQGYRWKNGVVVQNKKVDWEEFKEVVAVPVSFRSKIMNIAHDKTGHLGSEKVWMMVKKRFAWPGMEEDIMNHCKACHTCQMNSTYIPKKAPMVEE